MSENLQRIAARATSKTLQLAGRSILSALFVTAEVLIHLELGARRLHAYVLDEARTDRARGRSPRAAASCARGADRGMRRIAC